MVESVKGLTPVRTEPCLSSSSLVSVQHRAGVAADSAPGFQKGPCRTERCGLGSSAVPSGAGLCLPLSPASAEWRSLSPPLLGKHWALAQNRPLRSRGLPYLKGFHQHQGHLGQGGTFPCSGSADQERQGCLVFSTTMACFPLPLQLELHALGSEGENSSLDNSKC